MNFPAIQSLALRLCVLGSLLAPLSGARAYDLPAVNLGFTSFLDGGPPAGPGWYATQYLQFYRDGHLRDSNGERLLVPTLTGPAPARVNATIAITQLTYVSNQPLLAGGKWGMNLMLPLAGFELKPDNLALRANSGNLGDLLVGPFLQWDPIMGANGPRFLHRIELQMLLPTGAYDDDHALNPGSNFFSFNPYWAVTAFLTPKWTVSWRLHWLWNAQKNNPWRPLNARDSQAGQAFHGNLATAWEVIPQRLRIGLNGYFLTQYTDSEIDGRRVPDSKEQVFGIGPGLVWHITQHDHLFVNTYWETGAENRPEGNRFNLRYVHHFH